MSRPANPEAVKILTAALKAAKAGRINAVVVAGYLESEDGEDGHAGLGFHVESPMEARAIISILSGGVDSIAKKFMEQMKEAPRDGMPLHS